MHLEYTHDSDYFFFSQLLMRHIESYIRKHPDADNAIFDLRDIYEVFREEKKIVLPEYLGFLGKKYSETEVENALQEVG